MTLHMQVAAGTIYILVCILEGGVALPVTTKGWIGYVALPAFYAISVVCIFGAISMIGSIRAALIMNLEPVFTITAGFLILGQTLTPLQLVGAALVIAAVFTVRLSKPVEPSAAQPESERRL